MANIYRTHPERNLEDRISEVIHHTVDPGKLPTGSIIQTKYLTRKQDRTVSASTWHGIDELPFTPLLGTSLLRLSINYSIGAQAGNALYFFTLRQSWNMSCRDIIAEDFGKARRDELSKFIFKVQNNRGLVL